MKKHILAVGVILAMLGCTAQPVDPQSSALGGGETPDGCLMQLATAHLGDSGAGNMLVTNDDDSINFYIGAAEGYALVSAHLFVGTDLAPRTDDGELDHAAFPYQRELSPPETDIEIQVPFSDLGVGCGDWVKIVLAVLMVDETGAIHPMLAYPDDTGFVDGMGYYTYFNICCNDEPDDGCTLTQGYWKNHPEEWSTRELTLGATTYTQTELLAIMNRAVKGDASVKLAHQLIAALLNQASGASGDDGAIDAAQNWMTAHADADGLLPYGTSNRSAAAADANDLNDQLTSFNEGDTGPGHCDDD